MDNNKNAFIEAFKVVQKSVNQTAHEKGWYDSKLQDLLSMAAEGHTDEFFIAKCQEELRNLEDSRRHALIHSEVSESLENIRANFTPDDKIPEFTGTEAELADTIIRIMDVAEERGWRVAEAVIAKAEFNRSRPYRHGNKTC